MDKTETAQPDSSSQTAATTNTDGATGVSQATGGPERSSNAGELLQRYLKAQATQISRIAASLNAYRQDVQKLEVSLIARIGDVDDDRRHAATRLQRTLQTQRDELDERLKRHGSLMAMLLLLFSLLVAGTLVFFLLKLNATQNALETQMSDLRKTLEQIEPASRNEPDPQTRAQLDRLSTALAGISKSIERLSEEAKTAPLDLDLHLQPESRPLPVSTARSEPLPEPESEPAPRVPAITPSEPAGASEPATEPVTDLEQALDTLASGASDSLPTAQDAPPGDVEPASPSESETESSASMPDHSVVDPEPAPAPEISVAAETETETEAVAETGGTDGLESRSFVTDSIQVGDRPFTVQLIGFHTLEALERFAADHVLPVVYYYRQEIYQGRPWFVLIHSLHETREAAETVVAKLPPGLANLNIWIRKLKADTELIEVRRLGS
jgi:DamX protein